MMRCVKSSIIYFDASTKAIASSVASFLSFSISELRRSMRSIFPVIADFFSLDKVTVSR